MVVPSIKEDRRKLGGSKTLGISVAGLSRLTLHYHEDILQAFMVIMEAHFTMTQM